MESKEVFLKEDIVWAFEAFIGLLKDSEAINPQTIRVVEQLKSQIVGIVPTHEIGSPWHTGTPTEDGNYLCHIQFYSEDYESDEEGYDIPYWFKNGSWEDNDENVRIIAWQKIEPYKEKEK